MKCVTRSLLIWSRRIMSVAVRKKSLEGCMLPTVHVGCLWLWLRFLCLGW